MSQDLIQRVLQGRQSGRTATLATDHKEAKATLLAVLRGDDPLLCARADFDALTQRNRELRTPEAIKDAMADQLAILEVAALRFFRDATTGTSDQRRTFAAVALRCQAQFVATAATLHRLNEESANEKAFVGISSSAA